MSGTSAIEWTEATWNPVVGCSHVSDGCDNCYAEELHRTRLDGQGVYPAFKPWTPGNAEHNVTLVPGRLGDPLKWRKPRMVFVNSMSDLFHPRVPGEFISRVWDTMAKCQGHTFQILTKRPKRMRDWCRLHEAEPLPNVWLGTSIEDGDHLDRADLLRETPAAVRFVSAEPLLGPLFGIDLRGIDWLIAGGESGARHRPTNVEWFRHLRDVCEGSGTAFFFKQWGGRTPKAGGRELDGRTYDEMPQAPPSPSPSGGGATTYEVPLVLTVLAESLEAAREVQEVATGLCATDKRLAMDVLSVAAPTPRERAA